MAVREGEETLLDIDKIGAIIWKNWLVLRRDRARLIPMLMFPLIMIVIYGSTAGVATKYLPVAVVDYDHSIQSGQATSLIYASQSLSVLKQLGSRQEGQKLMDDGQIKALFVIPPGFGAALLKGRPQAITVVVDESDPTASGVIKATVAGITAKFSSELSAGSVQQANLQLQQANTLLEGASESAQKAVQNPTGLALDAQANNAYRQLQTQVSAGAASLQSQKIALGNTVDNVVDPNELIAAGGFAAGTTAPVSGLLAIVSAQQNTFSTIQYYSALQAELLTSQNDAAVVYSRLSHVQAQAAASGQLVGASIEMMHQAQSSIASAQANTEQANNQLVSATFFEPYGAGRRGLDFLLPNILALIIFQGAAAGLGRAIAGERQNGSLTRVFLTPTSNVTIITGTQLFYLVLEAFRSGLMIILAMVVFGATIAGSALNLLVVLGLYSIGATGVGMILSVMAKSQEQYLALSTVIILPSVFLSGVFFPVQTLPSFLQALAALLPMGPAAIAFSGVMVKGFGLSQLLPQLAYLAFFGALTIAVSLILFKREST